MRQGRTCTHGRVPSEPGSALRASASLAPRSVLATIACTWIALPSVGQVTQRVDVSSSGTQAAAGGEVPQAGNFVSADGRFVIFTSGSSDLAPGDTTPSLDIFVRDRVAGSTEFVSIDSTGVHANGDSGLFGITMTPDGRFVAFYSEASNLVPGDTNGVPDVFLRDRLTGTTERVSVDSNGVQGNGRSSYPSLSPDGRFVGFGSFASNLVPGDSNAAADIFVRDRLLGTTERVSVSSSGVQGNADCGWCSISADGRYVAFDSSASNLVAGDLNGTLDVFVRDRTAASTSLISTALGMLQSNGMSGGATISADGRFIAFLSAASNLVAGDTNGSWDAFLRDTQLGTTERVSVGPGGIQSNSYSLPPSMSADGRFIAFSSAGTNLVPGISAGGIFVRDRRAGTTEYVSASTSGLQPNGSCVLPSISAAGRYVAFRSFASNLVPNDTNGLDDVFLHDRLASGFTSICHPGADNVLACPCGNPPAGSGRGCDNSSFTGGAVLEASGIAYLSSDTLTFTTNGETPNGTSVLLQGDALISTGVAFGQGVRCAGGTLRRLFVKSAVNGGIQAPDASAGDPTVSARSALLGDPILPGETRYYLVYYRDPIVHGGCSAISTFNATQTGSVTWWP